MQWTSNDLQKYVQEKEYIDTLLVPLIPISFSRDEKLNELAFKGQVLTILMNELERELHGRVLLSLSYPYLSTDSIVKEVDRLNQWIEDAQQQPFEHIFLISHDVNWKKHEQLLSGSYIWLSNIPSVQIDSKEMEQFIREQMKQLNTLLQTYW